MWMASFLLHPYLDWKDGANWFIHSSGGFCDSERHAILNEWRGSFKEMSDWESKEEDFFISIDSFHLSIITERTPSRTPPRTGPDRDPRVFRLIDPSVPAQNTALREIILIQDIQLFTIFFHFVISHRLACFITEFPPYSLYRMNDEAKKTSPSLFTSQCIFFSPRRQRYNKKLLWRLSSSPRKNEN